METVNAVGRRKASIARVYLKNGDGKITVNGKPLNEYFTLKYMELSVLDPMKTVEVEGSYDLTANVSGGGIKGQAEALRLAISRALVKVNADFRPPLKAKKFMTRDARVVERKKFGKPKARKSFQFSKR